MMAADPLKEPASTTLEQTLQQAAAQHQAGQFQEAARLYQAILQSDPNHPVANHNLGILTVRLKQPAASLPYFMAALDADPACGRYWFSYIDALIQAGQTEDARQVLSLAMQHGLEGDEVEALKERLNAGTPAVGQRIADDRQITGESLPVSSPALQSNKPTGHKPVKPGKPVGKPVRGNGKSPDPREISALTALFNEKRYVEAASLAQTMTVRFPLHEFGWKAWGASLKQMGRSSEALVPMQKAVALSPRDAEAHNNLGNTLNDLGRLSEAEASYRRALKIGPDYAQAHCNLGSNLQSQGRLEEAEASCRRALKINPNYAKALCNLGAVLQESGKLGEAEPIFRRALEIAPDYADAHFNLGITLMGMDRSGDAKNSLQRALQINPHYADAHYRLGIILQGEGCLEEAETSHRRALQLKPDDVAVLNSLGGILFKMGRLDQAESILRRALQVEPDNVGVYNSLGLTLQNMGKLGEAEACYLRAMEANSNSAEVLNNFGLTLADMGRMNEAEGCFRKVLQLDPGNTKAHSNLLYFLTLNTTTEAEALFAEHCRFGERHEASLRAHSPKFANARNPERCLQVGFVSADFYNHAVSSFIEPVLTHLSGYSQVSLHAYSNRSLEDDVTFRIRKHFAHWSFIENLSDAALAEKIRADGIDILIDLSGHTAKNRLPTFALKPAPVQASWMGYPGTTGLRAMDYYLADRFLLPAGKFDAQFTEKIVRLPANAPFLPFEFTSSVNALPALGNGYLTFGSFNRPNKLSRPVIALWSQLLRALPDSRMVLGGMPQEGNNNTWVDWFAHEGIARERLDFYPRSDMNDYLNLYRKVDICLDTFPYNGGTTTLHAIWMGVPTLTLAGETMPGRVGTAALSHVGLEEFVARDAADFVQKGLFWAGNLAVLSGIRAGMREGLEKSAMSQTAVIAAGLERALRIMWQRWCADLPPESFEVNREEIADATQGAGK